MLTSARNTHCQIHPNQTEVSCKGREECFQVIMNSPLSPYNLFLGNMNISKLSEIPCPSCYIKSSLYVEVEMKKSDTFDNMSNMFFLTCSSLACYAILLSIVIHGLVFQATRQLSQAIFSYPRLYRVLDFKQNPQLKQSKD